MPYYYVMKDDGTYLRWTSLGMRIGAWVYTEPTAEFSITLFADPSDAAEAHGYAELEPGYVRGNVSIYELGGVCVRELRKVWA